MIDLKRWTLIFLVAVTSCAAPVANAVSGDRSAQPTSNAGAKVATGADADQIEEPQPLPTPETVRQINKDPASLAKAFYEFYLDGYPTMSGNEVLFMRFLTPRFYDEAEKIDVYDPFLDTQEGDDETWKNNIKVSNVKIAGSKATLNLLLDGKSRKWKAKLKLVKKAGTWKIDVIDMAGP